MILKNLSAKRYYILIIAFIICIGGALRIYKIAQNDLWFDEAISILQIENTIKAHSSPDKEIPYGNPATELQAPPYKGLDPQPFFYSCLLNIWIHIFDKSELATRSLSALFSIFTIWLIYKLGGILLNKKIGLVSAFLLSISPLHIWYAQETRAYALSVFLVLLGAYSFFNALEKNSLSAWIKFIIVTLIAIFTNYFTAYILLAGWPIFLLHKYRPLTKKWLLSNVIILIFLLPWSHAFWQHFLFVKNVFWTIKPSLLSLVITLGSFNTGYTGYSITFWLSFVILFSLFLFGIFCLKKEKKIFLLSFLFVPLVVTFIVSQKIPIYITRHMMLFSPFYYLIVAAGIINIKTKVAKVAIIIFITSLTAPSLINYFSGYMPIKNSAYHQGVYLKKSFKPAISYIEENWKNGDLLIYGHISAKPSFKYYQNRYSLKQNDKNTLNHKRIWLVSSIWSSEEKLGYHNALLKNALSLRYENPLTKKFKGITVDLYITGALNDIQSETNRKNRIIIPEATLISPNNTKKISTYQANKKLLDNNDTRAIKELIESMVEDFLWNDQNSMLEYLSKNYFSLSAKSIIDSDQKALVLNSMFDKAFGNNIVCLVNSINIKVNKLDIRDNQEFVYADYACCCTFFDIKRVHSWRHTIKRKAIFSKEQGIWKLNKLVQ